MCPLRWVVALLSLLVLLFFMSQLMLENESGLQFFGTSITSTSDIQPESRVTKIMKRIRGQTCWKFTVSLFTGELLYRIWYSTTNEDDEKSDNTAEIDDADNENDSTIKTTTDLLSCCSENMNHSKVA